MEVTAIVPWAGSKRTLAPTIVAELGRHKAYWELCCGSCAVLLAKPESSHETVADLNGDLTNLCRILQSDRCFELYERCARAIVNEDLYRHAFGVTKGPFEGTNDLERAYWFLVASWWGLNGMAGTTKRGKSIAVRFTPGGGQGGIRWRNATDSMPEWHERLRSVVVLRRDAFDVVDKIDDVEGVAIYFDPPYVVKGFCYLHDFEAKDHFRMAEKLRRFKKARVVVSYYDHPSIREAYKGWSFMDVSLSKSMVSSGRRERDNDAQAPELLIVNGRSYREGLFE